MIVIDLSKQKAPDVDPRTIQQIIFTGNLAPARDATIFLYLWRKKKNVLDFSLGIVKVL